jgi:hypothetical protein
VLSMASTLGLILCWVILKFLRIFKQKTLHFHFTMTHTNCVASLS